MDFFPWYSGFRLIARIEWVQNLKVRGSRHSILAKRQNPQILDSACSQDRMGAAPQGPPFWQDRMGAAPQFWIPPGACSQDRMGAAPFYPCFLCFFHHPQEFLSLEGRPPFYLFKKAAPRKFWILKVFSSPAALPSVKGWWNEAFQAKSVFLLFVKGMVLLFKHTLLEL